MALQSVAGWILFLVFGGWGLLAAPLDWVHEFARRPRTVIAKSQYLERARGIARRAREVAATADMLKRQDRASGGAKGRAWRGGVRALQREVVALEHDERALDASFPRGADGEARWVLTQLSYLGALLGGLVGAGLSLMWIAHVVVYMLPPVPLHPLLNAMFEAMDAVFPLFGVAFFALFTFYLLGGWFFWGGSGGGGVFCALLLFARVGAQGLGGQVPAAAGLRSRARAREDGARARDHRRVRPPRPKPKKNKKKQKKNKKKPTVVTIKGNFLLGVGLSFFTLYPIRRGATLMSSFLVNLALVMAAVPAVVQFSATAFGSYAQGTAVFDVFGSTATFLRGLSYVYRFNVFIYMLLGVCGISGVVAVIKGPGQGWRRRRPGDAVPVAA
jgi:hypothetical protein